MSANRRHATSNRSTARCPAVCMSMQKTRAKAGSVARNSRNARKPVRSTVSSAVPAGSARVAATTRPAIILPPSRVAARKQSSLSAKCA
ncbi:MAG TPA: hypothetical protein VNV62_24095 [Trebonia sp.]|jgi:hypothetical protein|nr:hypothetical protein [Trebonia sp.]